MRPTFKILVLHRPLDLAEMGHLCLSPLLLVERLQHFCVLGSGLSDDDALSVHRCAHLRQSWLTQQVGGNSLKLLALDGDRCGTLGRALLGLSLLLCTLLSPLHLLLMLEVPNMPFSIKYQVIVASLQP